MGRRVRVERMGAVVLTRVRQLLRTLMMVMGVGLILSVPLAAAPIASSRLPSPSMNPAEAISTHSALPDQSRKSQDDPGLSIRELVASNGLESSLVPQLGVSVAPISHLGSLPSFRLSSPPDPIVYQHPTGSSAFSQLPEPASFLLLFTGITGLLARRQILRARARG